MSRGPRGLGGPQNTSLTVHDGSTARRYDPPPEIIDPHADRREEIGALAGKHHGYREGLLHGAAGLMVALVLACIVLIGVRQFWSMDDMLSRRVAVQEADLARMRQADGSILDSTGNPVVTPDTPAGGK